MSERQKVFVALLASVLLHLIGMVVFGLLWATNQLASMASVPPPQKPLEVTLLTRPLPEKKTGKPPEKPEIKPAPEAKPTPVPAPVPEPPKPKATPKILRALVDSEGLAVSEKAPKNAEFSSDKNSVAGSEMPATNNSGLPGQAGKERPFTQFETKDYTAGKLGNPPGLKAPVAPAPVELPRPTPPHPTTTVQPTPAPPPPLFKPEPLPTGTPPPPPNPDAMKITKAAPTPQPAPFDLPKPKPLENAPVFPTPAPTPQKLAMLATPTPPRTMPKTGRNDPGFQEQKEAVKIEGGISNRGKKGVDSVETPLGRYRKSIATAISQRWNEHVREHMDLITLGTVRLKFYVTSSGRVEDIRLLSNTSTESFATYTIKSIMEAKIPPLPKDVVPLLENGRLEITEWSFTIYPE